jgi:hypothetical protein
MLMVAMLISCSDPVKNDLIAYINQGEELNKSFDEVNKKLEQSKNDPDAVVEVIRGQVIPYFSDVKEKFEKLPIKTQDVKKLNTMSIDIMERCGEIFELIAKAIEYKDEDRLTEAEEKMTEIENKIQEASDQYDKLFAKYEVKNPFGKFLNKTIMPSLN